MSQFLRGKTKPILKHLSKELGKKRGIKWFVNVKVRFVKHKPDGEDLITEPHFRSLCMKTVNQHELSNQLDEAKQKIVQSLVLFQKEGSGWILDEILHLDLCMAKYTPVKGSSYVPLPRTIAGKKAVINVKNSDSKCFMWAVLAALHPIHWKNNPERLHHYENFQDELNFNVKTIIKHGCFTAAIAFMDLSAKTCFKSMNHTAVNMQLNASNSRLKRMLNCSLKTTINS
ncbi:uncharacterized protein LOC114533268 [Dendronephthya gigantea]|nr:uncharacterized protein LOC114533268 [Dendronephthya gigantea]